jgi:hypothetical protein
MYMTNLSQLDSLREVNGKMGFNLIGRGLIWYGVPIWVLGLEYMVVAQGGSFASALGNTS